MMIEGEEHRGMVDTGASDCFISKTVRDQLPEEAIWDSTLKLDKTVRFGDSTRSAILETIRLRSSFEGIVVYYDFHVMENLAHSIIIGRNLLTDLRAEIKPAYNKVKLFEGNPVSVKQGVFIKPMEEKIVPVISWCSINAEQGEVVRIEPSGLSIAGVENVINYAQSPWWLKVANLTDHMIYLDRHDVIAYVEPAEVEPLDLRNIQETLHLKINEELGRVVDESAGECENNSMNIEDTVAYNEKAQKIRDLDLGPTCMDQEEQYEFKEMLVRNMDAIAFSMDELGHCTWSPMKIKVDDDQGVCVTRPYRYSPQKMDIIDDQIRQLLRLGIIEPSDSAWRSPLVVVQKKDGSARLCTDYRVLNVMTREDPYPMPTARTLFLYMAYKKPTVFTAMDLLSGYHQCDLHPDSRKYSAFESPTGVWQWRRVPFGMKQSPWQFTKIMSLALGGLMPRTCLAYLDDIIVFDPTVKEHTNSVEKVLVALRRAGLTVKPTKCEWARSEIQFLGHLVTQEGLKTLPKVTRKVQEFGRPFDKKTVKSFMGLSNYYRNFIPHFANTAVPLNRLLRNNVPFVWSEECEQAFRRIQDCLVAPPVLVHPQIGGHFYVLTDASDNACGAVIGHMVHDLLHPVVYYGYTFNTAERNYTVTEREGLAVVKVLKEHEGMLSGGQITIITDHQPLLPLLQQASKAPSKRLKRWALALTDFNYKIVYAPGKQHHLPDFLSRVVMKGTPERIDEEDDEEYTPEVGCELLEILLDQDELSAEEFRREQWKDREYKPLLDYLLNEELPEDWDEAKTILVRIERLGIDDEGILCKFKDPHKERNKRAHKISKRIMVPQSLVPRVLYLLHDDLLCGGHVGTTALQCKLVDRFYWKNMYMDAVEYVRRCDRCALRKISPHYRSKTKTWNRPDYPWQVVQTDFIGPLRKSREGYQYILTFIDLLTGWPEAFPTKNSTAATAATFFLQQIVCRYGKVKVLNSDRGPSYISKLFKEIASRLMCKQSYTSARMPQGNARVERLHKTLEDAIGCYITDNHENWPDLLPIALWNVRSTISRRTGFSPYALLFGRDNASMGVPEEKPLPAVSGEDEWFLRVKHSIELFDEVAKKNTETYEKDMKSRLDKGARPVQFLEGEFVYYYDPVCAANNLSKFSGRYRGPYRVEEAVADNRVKLRSLRTGKTINHLVNVNKLKRAYLDEEVEEIERETEAAEHDQLIPEKESETEDADEGQVDSEVIPTASSEEGEDGIPEAEDSGIVITAESVETRGEAGSHESGTTAQIHGSREGRAPPGDTHGPTDQGHAPPRSQPLQYTSAPLQKENALKNINTVSQTKKGRTATVSDSLKLPQLIADDSSVGVDQGIEKDTQDRPSPPKSTKKVVRILSSKPSMDVTETSGNTESDDSEDYLWSDEGEKRQHPLVTQSLKDDEILRQKAQDEEVHKKLMKRKKKQEKTLTRWSDKTLNQEVDSDEKRSRKEEIAVNVRGRNERRKWETLKEKELLEAVRKKKKEERDARAKRRLHMRDKVAQKGATHPSEEEGEKEDPAPEEEPGDDNRGNEPKVVSEKLSEDSSTE